MMYSKKRYIALFVATTLLGSALHFLFMMLPNLVTAFIAPVNESLWEHVKLIFWPYLAAMFVVTQGKDRKSWCVWLKTLVYMCAILLLVAYLFHVTLGWESLVFDIALYVAVMAWGFSKPYKKRNQVSEKACVGWLVIAIILAGMILVFTVYPPDHILFQELTAVRTWATIPV